MLEKDFSFAYPKEIFNEIEEPPPDGPFLDNAFEPQLHGKTLSDPRVAAPAGLEVVNKQLLPYTPDQLFTLETDLFYTQFADGQRQYTGINIYNRSSIDFYVRNVSYIHSESEIINSTSIDISTLELTRTKINLLKIDIPSGGSVYFDLPDQYLQNAEGNLLIRISFSLRNTVSTYNQDLNFP